MAQKSSTPQDWLDGDVPICGACGHRAFSHAMPGGCTECPLDAEPCQRTVAEINRGIETVKSVTIKRRGDWHPVLTDPTHRLYGTAVSRQLGPEHMDLLIDGRGFRLGLSDEQVIGYELLMAGGLYPSREDDLVDAATEIGFAYAGADE